MDERVATLQVPLWDPVATPVINDDISSKWCCLALWLIGFVLFLAVSVEASQSSRAGFAGSASCRECHERFYELWAPSHHGLAMQPYTADFAAANLELSSAPIAIGSCEYQACVEGTGGRVQEEGPQGSKRYPIAHVLGGKNVYYFLTPMERGRLQVLPLAYDVRKKQWFDTTASGVRHFPGTDRDVPMH